MGGRKDEGGREGEWHAIVLFISVFCVFILGRASIMYVKFVTKMI